MTNLFTKNSRRSLNSDIDVTPFVDVMLVLLIIFMITSPMLINGVEVNLPEAKVKNLNNELKPITISIDKNRTIYLEDAVIGTEDLVEKLGAIMQEKSDAKIFIRGDKSVDYGLVLQVFANIKEAGFDNVGLITTEATSSTKHKR